MLFRMLPPAFLSPAHLPILQYLCSCGVRQIRFSQVSTSLSLCSGFLNISECHWSTCSWSKNIRNRDQKGGAASRSVPVLFFAPETARVDMANLNGWVLGYCACSIITLFWLAFFRHRMRKFLMRRWIVRRC